MSNARFFSAIAVTAVVTGALVAALSRPAEAAETKSVECATVTVAFGGQMNIGVPAGADGLASWMTTQIGAGRAHFFSAGPPAATTICAW